MASSHVVYLGNFLHCNTLTDLSILQDHAICVNADGIIEIIEPAGDRLAEKLKSHGWESWKTVRAAPDRTGFWFPGFIGKAISRYKSYSWAPESYSRCPLSHTMSTYSNAATVSFFR